MSMAAFQAEGVVSALLAGAQPIIKMQATKTLESLKQISCVRKVYRLLDSMNAANRYLKG